jgi:hypothetical protein
VHDFFFYTNADTCVLGFRRLSVPAWGGVGFGRVYIRYGERIPSFQCFTVSISGGVGRILPVVMMVSCSQFHYVALCTR